MIHHFQIRTTMRNYLFTVSALFIVLQLSVLSTENRVHAQDQLRGFELYQEMGTPGFVQY